MMLFNYVTLTMLVVISNFRSVNNHKCYQCRSDVQSDCDELKDDTYLLDCEGVATTGNATDVEVNGLIQRDKNFDPYCRKVLQYLYFINSTTTNIVSRECTDGPPRVPVTPCYSDSLDVFTLYVCVCEKSGCNAARSYRTQSEFLLLLLCFRVIFPP